jgi:hypothetical protein
MLGRVPSRRLPRVERAALCCPHSGCRSVLAADQVPEIPVLVCNRCHDRYSLVLGELPVLVPRSSHHLAAEAIRLRRDLTWFEQQGTMLAAGERRFPRRALAQARIRAALTHTSNLLGDILETIAPHLDRSALVEVAAKSRAGAKGPSTPLLSIT